jgi:hypothetical protein
MILQRFNELVTLYSVKHDIESTITRCDYYTDSAYNASLLCIRHAIKATSIP